MELKAITYVGKNPGFIAKIGKTMYEFEWQKSLGVSNHSDDVRPQHAAVLSKWRDRRGRKMFIIE
jgi:hypothetical protein